VGGLLILVLLLVLFWGVIVVPRRRHQRAHGAMQESLQLGDEIITAGGIHGVVRELDEDLLKVEIAPGVVVTLDRRAVAAVAREVEVEVEPEPEDEHDDDLSEPAAAREEQGKPR
jgi:preprotein translocase subunit YajC